VLSEKNNNPSLFGIVKRTIVFVMPFALIFGIVFLLSTFNFQLSTPASAAFNQQINYQGKLADTSHVPVPDGDYDMRFRLCSDSSCSTVLWTETWNSGTSQVTVTNGLFSVMLGTHQSLSSIDFNQTALYLGVKIGSDSEMTPRKQLGAVPAAMEADRLDGWDPLTGKSGGFTLTGGTGTTDDLVLQATSGVGASGSDIILKVGNNGATEAMRILFDGKIGIGTVTPNQQLEITGNFRLPVTTATTGIIYSGANRFIHNYGTDNVFLGVNAGNLTLSGANQNTGIGVSALQGLTSGDYNTASGYGALNDTTTGSNNSAFGWAALYNNVTGDNNTAFGASALQNLYNSNANSGFGVGAVANSSTGGYNSGFGYQSLNSNSDGIYNTAIGSNADIDYEPVTPPSHTIAAGGSVNIGYRYYKVTYVIDGKETGASYQSLSATTTSGNQTVNLSDILIYSGGRNCTARKIYRTLTDNPSNSSYYLVDTISDNITTVYSDTKADSSLGSAFMGPSVSVAIGAQAKYMFSNQFVVGGNGYGLTDSFWGEGIENSTPLSHIFHGTSGTGTNIQGGSLTFAGGQGTGSGAGGDLIFSTSPAGSSGLTLNSLSERVRITSGGNVGIGTAAPSTLLQLGTAGTTAGVLSLAGATSGLVTLDVAAAAGTYAFTLPTSAGTNTYVLQTDGSGNTSWVDPSGFGTNYWSRNAGSGYVYPATITDNVGIGTATPSTFKLQVDGDVGPDTNDYYDLGSNSYRWEDLWLGPDTLHIGATVSDEYTIKYSNGDNRLEFNWADVGDPGIVFDENEHVGIGTTSPTSVLSVVASNDAAVADFGTSTNKMFALTNGAVNIGSKSTSAQAWTQSYNGTKERIGALAEYNGKLYAGQSGSSAGDGDVLVYDGSSWVTSYDSSTATDTWALGVYNGKLYAGVYDDLYSFDGSSWSLVYNGTLMIYSLAAYNGNLYIGIGGGIAGLGDVLVYDGSSVSTSYNGSSCFMETLAVYNGKLYAGQGGIIGDTTGDVYVYDGSSWTQSYNGARQTMNSLGVYNGKLYAGQSDNSDGYGDVYVYDGSSWTQSYDGPRRGILALAAYNNKLYAGQSRYVVGSGDVLVFNGSSWTTSYTGSQEEIRSLAVYNNKLYAGQGYSSGDGDVYSFAEAQNASYALNFNPGTGASNQFGGASIQQIVSNGSLPITRLGVGISGSELLSVSENGNVGIGTTSPGYPLDVNGVINAADGYTVGGVVAASGNFLRGNGTNFVSNTIQPSDVNSFAFIQNGNSFGEDAVLGTNDNYNLTFETNSSTAMTIDTSGNVGIGTATPSTFKLQVAGDIGPNANLSYDLGSDTLRFDDAYIGPASLHIGTSTSEVTLSYNDTNDSLVSSRGMQLGNSTGTTAGTIRYTGSDIEGYVSGTWKSLTQQAADVKQLVRSFTAASGETISAGDVVSFVNGELKEGTNRLGTESALSPASAVTYVSAATLDSTHFVLTYSDTGNSSYGTAVVGSVSGNTITWGSESVFNSATTQYTSVVALSSTQFAVAYEDAGNSNYGTANIGNVSGTSITSWGGESVFNSANATYYISVSALTSSKVVVSYYDSLAARGQARVATISGSSFTWGVSEYIFNSAASYYISTSPLYTDSTDSDFVIAYDDFGNSDYGTAIIGNVSGTVITFGSEYVFNSGISTNISTASLNDETFAVFFRDQSRGTYDGSSIIGKVAGFNISYGGKSVFSTNATYISSTRLSANKILVSYRDSDNSSYGTMAIAYISGDSISFSNEVVFASATTNYISSAYFGSNKYIIGYQDAGNSNYVTAIIGDVYPEIGVAKSAISGGSSGLVVLSGVSDGHSSLSVGTTYYANADGSLTATANANLVGMAISSTEILLQGNAVSGGGGGGGSSDWAESGSDIYNINAGNVGIGDSTPTDFKLEIAGNVGPTTNDTYALGSATLRWSDLYLGAGTLHIGTSATDESLVSYDTTNNTLEFKPYSNTSAINSNFEFQNAAGTSIMTVDSTNSRVGINATPNEALTVGGYVSLQEQTVNPAASSGYGKLYSIAGDGGIDTDTKLMLHANGTDASTTFTDSSLSPKSVTANGNAQLDTAQKKFGTASGLFDGTGDYLSLADSDDWNFGSGNFTIDFWVRFNSLPGTSTYSELVFGQRSDGTHFQDLFVYNSSGTLQWRFRGYNGASSVEVNKSTTLSTGVWYHMAIVRNGTDFKIFQNGTQLGTTNTSSITMPDVAAPFYIASGYGVVPPSTVELNGWLDEFRISKGVARWTSNFTSPTAEYGLSGGLYYNGVKLGTGGSGESLWTANGNDIYYNTGNVGIGDTSPDSLLDILSGSSTDAALTLSNTSTGDPVINLQVADGTNTFTIGIDNSDSDKFKISTTALGTNDRFVIDSSGNVSIGASSAGGYRLRVTSSSAGMLVEGGSASDGISAYGGVVAVRADGTSSSNSYGVYGTGGYMGVYGVDWTSSSWGALGYGSYGVYSSSGGGFDIAETYFKEPGYDSEKGDVVVISPDSDNKLRKSSTPYDPKIAGVYSTRPSLLVDEEGIGLGTKEDVQVDENKIPLALAGRVPVKVTDENGPIQKGDYVTSSSTAGHAMKATHAGNCLGIAMEDFNGTSGTITILIKLGWQDPSGDGISSTIAETLKLHEENISYLNDMMLKYMGEITVTEGNVYVNKLNVTTAAEIDGKLNVKGQVAFNKDTVGEAKILAGANEVEVVFEHEYEYQPVVTITQLTNLINNSDIESTMDVKSIVKDVTTKGFKIYIKPPQTKDIMFSWHAFGSDEGKIFVSDGTTEDIELNLGL